jgi:hypothetical protein
MAVLLFSAIIPNCGRIIQRKLIYPIVFPQELRRLRYMVLFITTKETVPPQRGGTEMNGESNLDLKNTYR